MTVSFAGLFTVCLLLLLLRLILEILRFRNAAGSAGETLPIGNPFPWPSVNSMSAGSPSRLEGSTCGLALEEIPSPEPMVCDGVGSSFLPGNEAGLGGLRVGYANDEQYDFSCTSRPSEAVGLAPNVEIDCGRPPERENEDRRVLSRPTPVPDAPGYAPTTHNGYSKYNDRYERNIPSSPHSSREFH